LKEEVEMTNSKLKVPVAESDHHLGSMNSSVVLVEYADFECPYSAEAAPEVEKMISQYGSKIGYVYRHFPIRSLHPHARLAAVTAEAAYMQGQFWAMHQLLFENFDALSIETVMALANTLELDMVLFRQDLQSDNLLYKVEKDFNGGVRSGVSGTPTFFLNDELIEIPATFDNFSELFDEILDEGMRKPQTGIAERRPSF